MLKVKKVGDPLYSQETKQQDDCTNNLVSKKITI